MWATAEWGLFAVKGATRTSHVFGKKQTSLQAEAEM